jgi:uncharacterized membrane protein
MASRSTVLLIASLGLNMLLGGFMIRHQLEHPHGPPGLDGFVDRMASGLPAADAGLLRQSFNANRATLEANEQWRSEFHERIAGALISEPFDPAKLEAVFVEADRHDGEFRRAMGRSILDAAAHMSAEGRQGMAKFKPH